MLVAKRVADELDSEQLFDKDPRQFPETAPVVRLGRQAGYSTRFEDVTEPGISSNT